MRGVTRRGGNRSAFGATIAAVCALGAPAVADAARVDVKDIVIGPREAARGGTPVVVYTAGAGERNRLVLKGAFTTRVVDRGAVIKAGKGCERVTVHKAKCEIPMTRRLDVTIFARASLKGGADRAEGTGIFWQRLRGGSGADRLFGGPSGDFIDGGTGPDLIRGGNSPNNDTAVYTSRKDDLRIDLNGKGRDDGGARDGRAGSRDRLVGIENVFGGKGDDVLRGDDASNVLIPILGEDIVRGLDGGDFIDLGRDPFGGGPADQQFDRAICGAGNDSLQGYDLGLDELAESCEA
jgi:Ca2+-binding RTX toxin-like protein